MARSPKPSGRTRRRLAPERDLVRPEKDLPTRVVHICCEGEKTEYQYFSAWKNAGRLKEIKCYKQCRNIEEVQVQIANQFEKGDEVYWLFDTERPNDGVPVERHCQQAVNCGIHPIPSNPSFEYWLLLHYAETSSPFGSASELVSALKKYIPAYDKGMNVYECVWNRTAEALERATRLRSNSTEPWETYPNPSTDVALLACDLPVPEKPR